MAQGRGRRAGQLRARAAGRRCGRGRGRPGRRGRVQPGLRRLPRRGRGGRAEVRRQGRVGGAHRAGRRHAAPARGRGIPGQGGIHAAKGGRTDLSDQSVINAVDYMVAPRSKRRHRLDQEDRVCRPATPLRSLLARLLLLSGCVTPPPEPRVDARPAGELRRLPDLRLGTGAGRRTATTHRCSSSTQNIRAAIATEMQRNGLHRIAGRIPTCGSPMRPPRRRKSRTIRCASASASAAGAATSAAPSTSAARASAIITEGTLVIHAIDAASNAEVWQGSVSRQADQGQHRAGGDQHAVATAMRDFPARSAGALVQASDIRRPAVSLAPPITTDLLTPPTAGSRRRASAACGTGACAPCRRAWRAGRPCRCRAAAAA